MPAALKVYDSYVAQAGKDDVSLLVPIAEACLRGVTAEEKGFARFEALGRLAGTGDSPSRRALEFASSGSDTLSPEGVSADAALARLGDARATGRLADRLNAADLMDKAFVINTLVDARDTRSASQLVPLLTDRNPATKAAAARGLVALDARSALGDLKAAFDEQEDGPDRLVLAAAMKALGSRDVDDVMGRMLASPASNVRLLAVEALAASQAPGWIEALRPFLTDASIETRLRAAELLTPVDPSAKAIIVKACTDGSPATRDTAARMIESLPPYDLRLLRRLLVDTSPFVRTHAAGAVLRAAQPGTP